MKKITPWLHDSSYIAPLSPACRMCAKGSKMVVLITGLCSATCYYCPLSFKKGGTDRIFADEWELENEKDTKTLIREAELIEATGAGITGGDPLVVWKRTRRYITLLKEAFGDRFNIHLYTSALANAEHLGDLVSAGLDEVRFHPLPQTWATMQKNPIRKVINDMVNSSVDVAIEVPVIPTMGKELLALITWTDEHGVRWVNLNELEFSERNCGAFIARGYTVKNDISAAVQGSQQTALTVLRSVQKKDLSLGVHYCSVSFKDGVQLRNRLKRRAKNIARPYDIITKDGTLIKGVVSSTKHTLRKLVAVLRETYRIPNHLSFLDTEKNRIELAAWLLEKHARKLTLQGYDCYIVEEYPTADRLEVERTPMRKM
ncbi:MAG TPA: radical SAM protein [Candidatus Thermoplasmatota archaeon]|nr:radical SAM protein [Candidatus Thermoplasmatota archaeon]